MVQAEGKQATSGNGQTAPRLGGAFVLGVDLDGVCANFAEGLKRIASEWLDVPEDGLTNEPTRDYPEWHVAEAGGFDALYRYAAARRDLFRDVPPVPGASLALRRLRKLHGIRIRIITHRLYFPHFHRHAVSQTIEWLDRHDFPYDDLCIIEDKTAVKADLYVEDSPSNIEALRAGGSDVIAFMTSMNRHHSGPRAHTWLEVEDQVTDFFTEWKQRNGLL